MFYGNLFSALIIFIAVIWFTSQMAGRSEIIAIISSGVSFNRFLRPYALASTLLVLMSLLLNHWLVPRANVIRLDFENTYLHGPGRNVDKNVHQQVRPGEFIYMESFDMERNTGYQFTYEKFNGNELTYKLMSDFIRWDTTTNKWQVQRYRIRTFEGDREILESGRKFDTTYAFTPADLKTRKVNPEMLNTIELLEFIDKEELKGSENIPFYRLELHQRTSLAFAIYILALIGVSIASRKVRGGIGIHLALSVAVCLIYIMSMQVTKVYATNAGLSPLLAVWIPNIFFGLLAVYVYVRAPK
jgi:lipopolysaccharide export system permease protein